VGKRLAGTLLSVLPLDTLADKPPEPMTREDFVAVLKHVRGSMDTFVTLEKKDVKRMLDEIRWLKRRLRRVEYVLCEHPSVV
jgi:hypothetical protein